MGLKDTEEPESTLVAHRLIERAHQSCCVFSVQLITDWLSIGGFFCDKPWEARINLPGTMSDSNWSVTLPLSLEDLCSLKTNHDIRAINETSGRI